MLALVLAAFPQVVIQRSNRSLVTTINSCWNFDFHIAEVVGPFIEVL